MRSSGRSKAAVAIAATTIVVGLSGCAVPSWFPWFHAKPKPAPAATSPTPVPRATATPAPAPDVEAVRAACANYDAVFFAQPFPRDAIIRGLDSGHASVRFQVDDGRVAVTSVTASDPAFGQAAVESVRQLQCRVERTTIFEIPFDWRTAR